MRNALAIVGTHPRTRENAPWNDPDIDVWVLNEAGNSIWVRGRIDGVVQIHAQPVYRSIANKTDKNNWAWLQQEHAFPIYMQAVDPLVPASVRYPLDEIKWELLTDFVDGITGNPFTPFTNSVSYCIALGIYMGYDVIKFYGVEMESNTEYSYQRENVALWTGIAVGRGVRVEMYCAQDYFNGPIYGYEGAISLDPDEYVKDFDQLKEAAEARKQLVDKLKEQDEVDMQAADPDFKMKRQKLLEATISQGQADGLVAEAERYQAIACQKITETGTAIIDRTVFEMFAAAAKIDADMTRNKLMFDGGRCLYIWDQWYKTRVPIWLTEFKHYSEFQFENAYQSGKFSGVEQYNRLYMQIMDEKIQAAGGKRAVDALTGV